MKLRWATAVGLCLLSTTAFSETVFDQYFTGQTLRLDYYHTGTAETELLSLDRMRIEGPWPGSRTQLLDPTNLGKYRFEVVDVATQQVLYSRGFASIFGEWETTGEAAQGIVRTLPEAIRFPEPRRPVQIRLYKRGADQLFREIWSVSVDPVSRFVERSAVAPYQVRSLIDNGEPAEKVDLVILGDGYTEAEMEKFSRDAEQAVAAIFSQEPFASRQEDFNVRAVESPAVESGISRPRSGTFRDSPLGASYNSLDSERYVLSVDDRAWRDVAATAPYDVVLILVNSEKYGGGGIYNLYSTAAVDSGFQPYLVVHEFGHHFAGLGDEYYTSDVAYEDFLGDRAEPWEPNITALANAENLKWGEMVEDGTPLPTPWKKQEFEEFSRSVQAQRRELRRAGAPEATLEALFRQEREHLTAALGAEEYAGKVGAFEGASYEAQGLYRPSADCLMFTRDEVGFCPVCGQAIERIIDLYSN